MPLPESYDAHFNPLEAACAWVVPGLGHVLLGQRARGLIIGVTILALWTAGLLIGGITSIDHKKQLPGWYLAQMLLAPTLAVDYMHQSLAANLPKGPQPTDNPPAFIPAIGKVAEQGILFTALAGLLNLLAIIDVFYSDPNERREDAAEPRPDSSLTTVPPVSPVGTPGGQEPA